MGPWYARTPWPGVWWNLNVQLTYWPVYAANRLALGESMLAIVDVSISQFRQVHKLIRCWRGTILHCATQSAFCVVRPAQFLGQ